MGQGNGFLKLLPRLCVPAALAFLASRLLMLEGLRYLNSLYEKLFEAAGFLLFVLSTLLAIIILIVQVIRRRPIEPKPLAFALVIGLIIYFAPLDAIMIHYDFYNRLPERTRIVEDILTKIVQLKPLSPGKHIYHVPPGYGHVSNDDVVLMEGDEQASLLLFFFDRWILGNYSGFMYRPDDSMPTKEDFGGNMIKYTPLASHWFFVEFT